MKAFEVVGKILRVQGLDHCFKIPFEKKLDEYPRSES